MLLHINRKSAAPIYSQIYNEIKQWIVEGNLEKDAPLPSKRELAYDNHISVNTVMNAYDQLLVEGYIYSKPRKGYFVSNSDFQFHSVQTPTSPSLKSTQPSTYSIDLFASLPDDTLFPFKQIRHCMNHVLDSQSESLLKSSPIEGESALRDVLQHYLSTSRGVPTTASHIVLGPSSNYLLRILLDLLPSIRHIGIENPGYHDYVPLFESKKHTLHPLSVDEQGLIVNDLTRSKTELLIVTPNHQYPTGTIMPLERRLQLLKWVNQKANRWIIEDDYDSEYRYSGMPIPSLKQLDTHHKVIYMSSLSRTLASGFRISYMVLPPVLLNQFNTIKNRYAPSLNTLTQLTLAKFISDGQLDKHLNRSRRYYKRKRDLLIHEILKRDTKAQILGEDAGLHLLCQPSHPIDLLTFKQTLQQHNIRLKLLQDFLLEPSRIYDEKLLFMSFSSVAIDKFGDSVKLIWDIIEAHK